MPTPNSFLWATGSTYTAPGDAWDATPTRVTPTADQVHNGFEWEDEVSAPTLNYILGEQGDWIQEVSGNIQSVSSSIVATINSFSGSTAAEINTINNSLYVTNVSIIRNIGAQAFFQRTTSPVSTFTINAAGGVNTMCPDFALDIMTLDLRHIIVPGSNITAIFVLMRPGTAIATQANRVMFELDRVSRNFLSPAAAVVSSTISYADATNAIQNISFSLPGGITLTNNEHLLLRMRSSSNSSAVSEEIYGVQVTMTRTAIASSY